MYSAIIAVPSEVSWNNNNVWALIITGTTLPPIRHEHVSAR